MWYLQITPAPMDCPHNNPLLVVPKKEPKGQKTMKTRIRAFSIRTSRSLMGSHFLTCVTYGIALRVTSMSLSLICQMRSCCFLIATADGIFLAWQPLHVYIWFFWCIIYSYDVSWPKTHELWVFGHQVGRMLNILPAFYRRHFGLQPNLERKSLILVGNAAKTNAYPIVV
jgi:hypothetical protein